MDLVDVDYYSIRLPKPAEWRNEIPIITDDLQSSLDTILFGKWLTMYLLLYLDVVQTVPHIFFEEEQQEHLRNPYCRRIHLLDLA